MKAGGGGRGNLIIIIERSNLLRFFVFTLIKLGIEGNYVNTIKSMYEKPTLSFMLNGETLKAFPLRLRTR